MRLILAFSLAVVDRGVKPVLFVKGNDLIDPLSSALVIFCNFPDRSSPLPMIYDSSDILVG